MTNGHNKIRLLTFALVGSCVIAAIGVLFNCAVSVLIAISVFLDADMPWDASLIHLCIVVACDVLADLMLLGAFIRFTSTIIRSGNMFGSVQTNSLLIVAVAMLLRTLFGLALPYVQLPQAAGGLIGQLAISPTLDLRLLSLSFIFFALACIFGYGRLLQEDSDDIL